MDDRYILGASILCHGHLTRSADHASVDRLDGPREVDGGHMVVACPHEGELAHTHAGSAAAQRQSSGGRGASQGFEPGVLTDAWRRVACEG